MTALVIFVSAHSLTTTFAADVIQFSAKELNALYILGRPDLATAEAQGKTGVFIPSPPMKYFGVQEQNFPIDLGFIGAVTDLHFNQLQIKTPTVQFLNSKMVLVVPIADNPTGIKSDVGSIGFKNVSVTATLDWSQSNTNQELRVESLSLQGLVSGTGILANDYILKEVKKLAMQIVKQSVQNMLSSQIQDMILTGMVQWAKISTGNSGSSVVPGSIQIFSQGDQSGIRYSIE